MGTGVAAAVGTAVGAAVGADVAPGAGEVVTTCAGTGPLTTDSTMAWSVPETVSPRADTPATPMTVTRASMIPYSAIA